MTLNFQKNSAAIQSAYDKVASSKTGDEWVILDYEGSSNVIKVGDEGEYGLDEFATSFNSGRLQYGVISVRLSPTVLPKIVLVHWQGEGVPSARVAASTAHAGDVRRYLKTVHVLVYARSELDVEPESIRREVAKLPSTHSDASVDTSYSAPTAVGSVYTPIRPHVDINVQAREQFWDKMNTEETQRKKEEIKHRTMDAKKWADDQAQMTAVIHDQKEQSEKLAAEEKRQTKPSGAQPANSQPKRLVTDRLGMFDRKDDVPIAPASASSKKPTMKLSPSLNIHQHEDVVIDSEPEPYVPPALPKSLPPVQADTTPSPMNSVPKQAKLPEPPRSMVPQYEEPPAFESSCIAAPPGPTSALYEEPPSIDVMSNQLKAVALWDYQAADDTEISFDPDEVITEIDQVDEGWWRGRCPKGRVGLFPANYVSLL